MKPVRKIGGVRVPHNAHQIYIGRRKRWCNLIKKIPQLLVDYVGKLPAEKILRFYYRIHNPYVDEDKQTKKYRQDWWGKIKIIEPEPDPDPFEYYIKHMMQKHRFW